MPSPEPTDPRPAVSVLMAVHDGMPYLEAALRSIMTQTLDEIEIVVVDDASRDASPQVLARLAGEDRRIRLLTLAQNRGLAGALNAGLDLVRADYVARMDADDIALPERLAVQKAYLDRHPQVVLLGSSFRQIDAAGRPIRTSLRPRDPVALGWTARFGTPVNHPTVLIRRAGLPEGVLRYDPALAVAQDYALWERLLAHGAGACLPQVLLDYRVHAASLTGTRGARQAATVREVAARIQKAALPGEVFAALAPLRAAYFEHAPLDAAGRRALFAGMRAMLAHDVAAAPGHQLWMRRQAAQILAESLRRSGGHAALLRGFLGPGRDFLPALLLRFLEVRRLLPARLRSDPAV